MADENGNGSGKASAIERLLSGLEGISAKVDSMCGRLDAIEARPAALLPDRGATPLATVVDGDVTLDPGAPMPTAVGDGLNGLRKRRADLASFQQRADSVAQLYGEAAAPPLTNEALNEYKRRTLLRWSKHSPVWKDVDLYKLDSQTLEVAASQIFQAAADEGARPLVPVGNLMERKMPDGNGHIISTFWGSPHVWMRRFMGPRKFVNRINLRPTSGYQSPA